MLHVVILYRSHLIVTSSSLIIFIYFSIVAQFPLMAQFSFCMIRHLFQPDRIKQFGSVNRQYDRHGRQDVPYKPRRDLEAVGKDPNPRQQKDTPAEDTGKSHMDCSTALGQMTGKTVPDSETREEEGVPLLDYVNKDYHRDFSNMLGDVAIAR